MKNQSSENLGKNKELPAVGKSQRSLQEHIACKETVFLEITVLYDFFPKIFFVWKPYNGEYLLYLKKKLK